MPVPDPLRTDYRVVIADPPWEYAKTSRHHKLTGYSDAEYEPLSTDDLCDLPVARYTADDAVLFLWTTWPFVQDALRVVQAWGFEHVTGLPWVKVTGLERSSVESVPVPDDLKPTYGVGYWMRGCTEPVLIAKRPRAKAVRTNYVGLISENFRHSRKPDSLYELAEKFPGPRLELFARRSRAGWDQLGNEMPGDGRDIREVLR